MVVTHLEVRTSPLCLYTHMNHCAVFCCINLCDDYFYIPKKVSLYRGAVSMCTELNVPCTCKLPSMSKSFFVNPLYSKSSCTYNEMCYLFIPSSCYCTVSCDGNFYKD